MGNVSETRKILLDCKCATFVQLKKKKKTKSSNEEGATFKMFDHARKQKSLRNSN